MKYSFKKGQIIPKRIGKRFFDVHSSARYGLKWGANVEVQTEDHVCMVRATTDGLAIYIPRQTARKRKNGTFQKHSVAIRNIHFI